MTHKLFILFVLLLPVLPAIAEEPEPIKVYCFSADLEAGFKDDVTEYWCKELGNKGRKKKSITMAESRESANIFLEYHGTEKRVAEGETTFAASGYAWKPGQTITRARATLLVGDFSKDFESEASGANFVAPGAVIDKVEEWIRENRETILKKAQEKK